MKSMVLLFLMFLSAPKMSLANPAMAGAIAGSLVPFMMTSSAATYQRFTTDSALLSDAAAARLMQRLQFKPTRSSSDCYQEPTLAEPDGMRVCYFQRAFVPRIDTLWLEPDRIWPDTQMLRPDIFHARFGLHVSGNGFFPADKISRALFAAYMQEVAPNHARMPLGYDSIAAISTQGYWLKAGVSSVWSFHHASQGNLFTPGKALRGLLYGGGAFFDLLSLTPTLIGIFHPDMKLEKRAGLIAIGLGFRVTFGLGLMGIAGNEAMKRHNRFADAGLLVPREP